MSKEATTKARQKRKKDLVYIHGNQCSICRYDKCIGALQFHHINPKDKTYELSSGNCYSWESDIEESKKCILVCANCHTEIHFGIIEQSLETSFNEERYFEKNKDFNSIINKCKNWGQQITTGASYCAKCWSIINRRVERPSREELKQKIRTISFSEIGRQYGVSDNSIRKWCDGFNLPRRKSDIKKYSDEEWQEI